MDRTTFILPAFIVGWTKSWREPPDNEMLFDVNLYNVYPDPFKAFVMLETEGRQREGFNRSIAELFGQVITQVKAFPTDNRGWMIVDKHTKHVLHKEIQNENEVNALCKKLGYVR